MRSVPRRKLPSCVDPRSAAAGHDGLEALEARAMLAAAPLRVDVFEPNDRPRQVIRADEGVAKSPNLGPLTKNKTIRRLSLEDRADYFRFRIVGPGQAGDFVRINFNNRNGNLDLLLIGANGKKVLARSEGNQNRERVSLEGLSAGVYYALVRGKQQATNPTYRIFFKAPKAAAADDAMERGGNDTIEEVAAQPEGGNSSNLGTLPGPKAVRSLKLNDTWDIYRFALPGGVAGAPGFVSIETVTPLDMMLTRRDGTVVAFAEAYQGQTRIDFAGLEPGEYFLHVSHYALGTQGSFAYDLSFGG